MAQRGQQAVRGPLAPYAEGFAAELVARGYSSSAVRLRLWLLDAISRWLRASNLSAADLSPDRVVQFLADRRAAGYKCWISRRSPELPLQYLRTLGVVPTVDPDVIGSPVEVIVEGYRRYLVHERGLATSTVKEYVRVARLFLATRSQMEGSVLEKLDTAEVTSFLTTACAECGVASAQHLVAALRALLRYLHVSGMTEGSLVAAVPSVAGGRGATLPRGLPAAEVARLFASCDRRRAVGRRDYAILVLLVRLGLRAGEVATLRLDDFDWNRGEVRIRGKGDRHERLPLPVDVGTALAAYLRRGRGEVAGRSAFVRVKAPHGPLTSKAVQGVVHDACVRAGVAPVGAHRLRHTAATDMLRAGASLPEIAQVLRQRELATTAIYAKVDRAALRGLAQPWPGGAA